MHPVQSIGYAAAYPLNPPLTIQEFSEVVVKVMFCRSVPDQLDLYLTNTRSYTSRLGREQVV